MLLRLGVTALPVDPVDSARYRARLLPMPGWLRKLAIVAYGIFCLAFQARLSYDWLSKESEESERARRPFNIRLFDSEGLAIRSVRRHRVERVAREHDP